MLWNTLGLMCWLYGPKVDGKLSVNCLRLAVFPSQTQLTLYPDDLMCTPRLVRVDFMRMKKDRSRVLSVVSRLGLVVSTEEEKNTDTCDFHLCTVLQSSCSGATLEFTKNKWVMGAESVVINLPHWENVYFAEKKKKRKRKIKVSKATPFQFLARAF